MNLDLKGFVGKCMCCGCKSIEPVVLPVTSMKLKRRHISVFKLHHFVFWSVSKVSCQQGTIDHFCKLLINLSPAVTVQLF